MQDCTINYTKDVVCILSC